MRIGAKGSAAGRFISVVFLILVVGQSSLWIWFIQSQRASYAERLENKMQTIARLLATLSSTAITSSNYGYLDAFLDSLAEDEDIISVNVMDNQDNVVKARSFRNETGGKNLNPFYIPWSNSHRIAIKSAQETIGSVDLNYSGRQPNREMRKLLTVSILGEGLVLALVLYAIYVIFQRKIGKPVETIKDALARATAGDLTMEVPVIGSNEMGSIARGVRFLIERLSKTIERSNSISGDVAMAIEQLTVALRNVSGAAQKQAKSIDEVVLAIRVANDSQGKVRGNADKLSQVSSDNVSSLLQMKATAEEIALSTVKLFQSAEDSYAMVAEMSQSAKVIAGNAHEVFRAVEEASASSEEISASLNAVLDNARQSEELTVHLRELLTGHGTLAVADSITAMEKITEEVSRSAEIVTRLEERSKNIEKVLSVIKEVTESTNLLSLNAAILAAQAGEHGKSFAVVADEIRALSDRTSSSTRDIAMIVRTIQGEINEAVNSIRRGVATIETGKNSIFRAGEAMGESLEAAQRSAKMAIIIKRSSDEQAAGLQQITRSMENIRLMVEEMVKATEEQTEGSNHLLDSIGDVKEVAELAKRGTEEHAGGTKVITRNLEMTLSLVAEINRSSQEQQQINENTTAAVEHMKKAGAAAVRDMEELTLSLSTLKNEIETLKREIGVFKTVPSSKLS